MQNPVDDDNNPVLSAEEKNTGFTDWVNEPTVSDLKLDYNEAKSDKASQEIKIQKWLDNLNVTGSAKPKTKKNSSSVQPKLIRKQAEWRYSALSEPFLSSDDVFNISPVTAEDKKSAEQNALVLNNQFNTKIDKVSFIDEYVRTAVDEGTVIVRVGWEEETETVIEEQTIFNYAPVTSTEEAQMIQQALALKVSNPYGFETEIPEDLQESVNRTLETGLPTKAIPIDTEEVRVERYIKNQPTVEICDYRSVTIDPTCKGNLDKASFVIYSFETSIAELTRDGKYKNIEYIETDNASVLSMADDEVDKQTSFQFNDKSRKRIMAHEYWGMWDINGDDILVPIVATYVGDTLIRLEENPFPDGKHPFVSSQYLPVRKSNYGEPDGELLEDNQKIAGAVVRGMIDLMGKSANGQIGTAKGALDITNQRKFDRGERYEYNAGVDPRNQMYQHTYPEIPNSAITLFNMQNMEAEGMTGARAFGATNTQGIGDSATAARDVMDAASKREVGILRRLSNGIIKVGRKIIAMNAEFLDEEEVIRVTNSEFITVRRDDLAGNIDLRLTISTAEADDKKAQELAFMLQTMGNNMDPNMSKMILADIAKLRKMPALAQKIEEYQPQPDPMQIKKQELELMLLQAQIAEVQSKTLENRTDAELNMAKVGTEGEKAGNLRSDTDLKDLDFVEQEAGVKQERELEKQGAQAKAQGELKLLDTALKTKASNQKDTGTSNGLDTI